MWFDRRRQLIALAVGAWTLLVIVAAGDEASGSTWLRIPDLTSALAAAMLLTALLGLVMTIFLRPPLRGAVDPRSRGSLRTLILMAVGIAAVAAVIGPQDLPELDEEREQAPAGAVAPEIDESDEETLDAVNGSDLAVLIVIAAVAAGVLFWSGDRRDDDAAPGNNVDGLNLEPDLAPAIRRAADLLSGPDSPRSSVLAAYAGLEHALAERGRGRSPTETPTEHMRRVLGTAPVLAEPALLLGALYELARFSDHPISRNDHQRAAAALDRARHTLAATSSGSTT